MPEPRVSLEDIIRSAAADLPPYKRAIVLTDVLIELDGARGIELLSKARAAISLRMQELIDERVGASVIEAAPRVGFFDLESAKRLAGGRRSEETLARDLTRQEGRDHNDYFLDPSDRRRFRFRILPRRTGAPMQPEEHQNPEVLQSGAHTTLAEVGRLIRRARQQFEMHIRRLEGRSECAPQERASSPHRQEPEDIRSGHQPGPLPSREGDLQ